MVVLEREAFQTRRPKMISACIQRSQLSIFKTAMGLQLSSVDCVKVSHSSVLFLCTDYSKMSIAKTLHSFDS